MIRFACSNCSRLISVDEKYSGKKGKCPKCGGVVVVPERSTIIEFPCGSCGHKISVPQRQGGKKGKCPKCRGPVVVPSVKKAPAEAVGMIRVSCSTCNEVIEVPESSRGKLIECPHCGCFVEARPEQTPADKAEAPVPTSRTREFIDDKLEDPQRTKGEAGVEKSEPADKTGLRRFVDVLLYPTSTGGLKLIGAVAIGPALLLLGVIFSILYSVLMAFYVTWYSAECIRKSAHGGLRAPEPLSPWSMDWERVFSRRTWTPARGLGVCYLVFFGPLVFYKLEMEANNFVLWSLLTYGVFFFPMGLLAVTMYESISGLNPMLIVRSVIRTFAPYSGLAVFFSGLIAPIPFVLTAPIPAGIQIVDPTFSACLLFCVVLMAYTWLVLVACHLLGCFYCRHKERLDWKPVACGTK